MPSFHEPRWLFSANEEDEREVLIKPSIIVMRSIGEDLE